jgi:lipoprotein signal peptidase
METPVIASQEISKNERVYSFIFWFGVFIVLVVCDQMLKALIFSFINQSQSWLVDLLVGRFGFQLYSNTQFAFSAPLPKFLMYSIYATSVAALVWWAKVSWKNLGSSSKTAFILILAGGLSNLGERLITGSVRDYFLVANGIFNLADAYILVGVIWFLVREFWPK